MDVQKSYKYPQKQEKEDVLFFTPLFPTTLRLKHSFKNNLHSLTLGIGGNLKSPIHTFNKLFFWLKNHSKIFHISTSPIYKNPPFGYEDQPHFYNATIKLYTSLCIHEVFSLVFYLERRFGRARKRDFKNAPRTLDIDILFFDDLYIHFTHLKVPHPYFKTRESVIIPLMLQHID